MSISRPPAGLAVGEMDRGVEPGGGIGVVDFVDRPPAEGGEDAGLEIDARGLAPGGFPIGVGAAQILLGERLERLKQPRSCCTDLSVPVASALTGR